MLKIYLMYQFWFLISFALFWVAYAKSDTIARLFETGNNVLARAGKWRTGIHGSLEEIPKFAFLRIAFGLFLLNRAALIAYYAYPTDWAYTPIVIGITVSLVCAILLIAGFAVQWAFIVLCLYQWQIAERYLETSTLGNDIAAILSLFLFLTNAGSRVSCDSLLIKQRPQLRKYLLYFNITNNDVISAKVLSLFCYWTVCMYSFFMHLSEEAWMQGFAGPQLLTNNFMNRYYSEFEILFDVLPPAIYFFIASMWVMLPWYLLFLPFILLGGLFRTFIVVWGLLFFFFSTFVLSLGWLGEFEFIFWACLFLYRTGKVDLIYDDKCNLCDRTVNAVKRLDLLNTVRLKPISKNLEWAAGHNLNRDDVLRDLYGYDESRNKLASGYDLYLLLTRSVLILLPLWPIFYLGKVLHIGPMIYRFIADRRIKYFGICMLPTPKPSWSEKSEGFITHTRAIPLVSMHVLALGFFFVIAIPAPFAGWYGVKNPIAQLAHTYGMAPINVFNRADLLMTEKWFVIEEQDGTRVPVFYPDGSRDIYHRSDRVYYGGTVAFRRWAIDQEKGCLFETPFVQRLIRNFGALHTKITDYEGPYRYRQYYKEIAGSEQILDMEYIRHETSVTCEAMFDPAKSG